MWRRGDGLFLVGVLAACLFGYAPGLGAAGAHDDALLTAEALGPPSPGRFLGPAPQHPLGIQAATYAYRPLTETSFLLNPGGLSIPALRAGNLTLHALAAVGVLWLARLLGPGDPWFARLAAMGFVVHPLGLYAVTYVYQRAAGLEALLAFLCMGLYWTSRGRGGWRYAGALAAGLLAAGAKETAATLPLLLAALEWIRREPGEPLARVLKRWLPFLLVPAWVGFQVWRASRLAPPAGPFAESLFRGGALPTSPLDYLGLQLGAVAHYLRLSVWPFPLHFLYDRRGFLSWPLAGALLAALLGWVLLGPRRHALPRLGSALFLAPLALESSVIPIRDVAFNHRCYPGLLGASLAFAWAVLRLPGSWRYAGAAALALLCALTRCGNAAWTDTARLLAADVRAAPGNALAWGNRARMWTGERPGTALALLRRARRLPWQDAGARMEEARALDALGRRGEARRVLSEALDALPRDPALLWAAFRLEPEGPGAEALARRAEALPELPPAAAVGLARRRMAQGEMVLAAALLERQVGVQPRCAPLWEHLGWALQRLGRLEAAAEAYRRALALAPGSAKARSNLELVLRALEGGGR